LKNVVAVS